MCVYRYIVYQIGVLLAWDYKNRILWQVLENRFYQDKVYIISEVHASMKDKKIRYSESRGGISVIYDKTKGLWKSMGFVVKFFFSVGR